MAFCLANGAPVMEATITLPRAGAWTADVVVDANSVPSNPVTLVFGADNSISYIGTLVRAGTSRGAVVARIVGGKGGLDTVIAAKAYNGIQLQIPLADICNAAGETLSASSDAASLATQLTSWTRMQMPARRSLAALMGAIPAAVWRFRPDASLWVGPDLWPASALVNYVLTKDDPNHKRQEIAADIPNVFPGEIFAGSRVSGVEHHFGASRLRTTVYFEG